MSFMSGFVYVARRLDGAHKIGFSRAPNNRRRGLQSAMKQPIQLVYTVKRDDAFTVEQDTHKRLRPHALGGEWFEVSETDAIAAVDDCCYWADIRALQWARIRVSEEAVAAGRSRPSRRDLIRMELQGVFGEKWATTHRRQGWDFLLEENHA